MNKLFLILAIGLSVVACKKGPTDEQFKDLTGKAHQTLMNRDSSFEQNDEKVKQLLAQADREFDIMKAGASQFEALVQWNTLLRSQSVKNWIAPRLAQLAKQNDKEGVIAAYYQLMYNPARNKYEYKADEVETFLKHPAFGQVFKDSIAGGLAMNVMRNLGGEKAKKAQLINLYLPCINDEMADQVVNMSVALLYDEALRLGEDMPEADRQVLRERILAQQQRVLAKAQANNDQVKIAWAEKNIKYLSSLFATGKLIGGTAPELDFLWMSSGKAQKLSDLKGKVVVLDFWTTWCGPCVASFPNVRELQKRYKNSDVVILGVSSLQGRHVDRSSGKSQVVDTKGNPEEEFKLMKQFMKEMDITWTVAFSAQPVFNSEYGVNGIPHVVIIDTEGRVRYNNLRPYDAPFHEAEKIDALLQEAGLKYPKNPMSTENFIK